MAFNITLGELVLYSQQLANQVPAIDGAVTGPLTIPEWKVHVSTFYGRLHTTVADTGARYFETESTINLADLSLPSDHKLTIGVDFVDSAGRRTELDELMVQERNYFTGMTATQAIAWSFSATALQLFPNTPSSGTYKHLYVPQPARYNTSADSTVIDVVTSDGLEAIGWGVASVALHRAESDQTRALSESDDAFTRLKEWAVERSFAIPKRKVFTRPRSGGGSYSNIYGDWNPANWRNR